MNPLSRRKYFHPGSVPVKIQSYMFLEEADLSKKAIEPQKTNPMHFLNLE